jgi:hypothetical protein
MNRSIYLFLSPISNPPPPTPPRQKDPDLLTPKTFKTRHQAHQEINLHQPLKRVYPIIDRTRKGRSAQHKANRKNHTTEAKKGERCAANTGYGRIEKVENAFSIVEKIQACCSKQKARPSSRRNVARS